MNTQYLHRLVGLILSVGLLALTVACGHQKTYPEVDTAPPEPFRTSVSTPEEVRAEVEILISSFVQLNKDECDLSLACNSSFPPALEATAYLADVWESWGSRYKLPESIRRLVEIGPAAVPILCEHLDDERKTGLQFEHPHGGIGGTWFSEESDWNTGWQEARAERYHRLGGKKLLDLGYQEAYSFCVADICYATIGKIVNRSFRALRSQMTLCYVINSPVVARELARITRQDWGNTTLETLRLSLIKDFVRPDIDLNNQRARRTGAYSRLAVYFPDDAARLVKQLLRKPRIDGNNIFELIEVLEDSHAAGKLKSKWSNIRQDLSNAEVEILVKYLREDAHDIPVFPGNATAKLILRELFPREDLNVCREYQAVSWYELRDLIGDLILDEDSEIDTAVADILRDIDDYFPEDEYNNRRLASACVERLHLRPKYFATVLEFIQQRRPSDDKSSEELWAYYEQAVTK